MFFWAVKWPPTLGLHWWLQINKPLQNHKHNGCYNGSNKKHQWLDSQWHSYNCWKRSREVKDCKNSVKKRERIVCFLSFSACLTHNPYNSPILRLSILSWLYFVHLHCIAMNRFLHRTVKGHSGEFLTPPPADRALWLASSNTAAHKHTQQRSIWVTLGGCWRKIQIKFSTRKIGRRFPGLSAWRLGPSVLLVSFLNFYLISEGSQRE